MTSDTAREMLTKLYTLSAEDLRLINRCVVDQLNTLSRATARNFVAGDRVTWTGKYGNVEKGTVQSVMQKNVRVITDGGMRWRVAGSLLKSL